MYAGFSKYFSQKYFKKQINGSLRQLPGGRWVSLKIPS